MEEERGDERSVFSCYCVDVRSEGGEKRQGAVEEDDEDKDEEEEEGLVNERGAGE